MNISEITSALQTLLTALEDTSNTPSVDEDILDSIERAAQEARDRQSDIESAAAEVRDISRQPCCDVDDACDSAAADIESAASELSDLADTLDSLVETLRGN